MDHNTFRATRFLAVSALALTLPVTGFAAVKATTENLEAQATIQRAAAEKAALMQVPNGAVQSGKLEKKHRTLVWAFDVATPHSKNVTQVLINAKTGKILSTKIEKHASHTRQAKADTRMSR